MNEEIKKGSKILTYAGLEYTVLEINESDLFVTRNGVKKLIYKDAVFKVIMRFNDLSTEDLKIISHALYQAYNNMSLVSKEKRKDDYNDKENVLQRRINIEIKWRK